MAVAGQHAIVDVSCMIQNTQEYRYKYVRRQKNCTGLVLLFRYKTL